jgi:hypothetical protein
MTILKATVGLEVDRALRDDALREIHCSPSEEGR